MSTSRPALDVVLPVRNEAATIEAVLHEIYEVLSPLVDVRFIVCEDGSKDDSPAILRRLQRTLPLRLETGSDKKGYARAVLDGLARAEAGFVLVLDSDGQCDPRDFAALWAERHCADVVLGWRTRRQDAPGRLVLSRGFKLLFRTLFAVPLHDPSCPFALLRRDAVAPLLGRLGTMEVGFWWELSARAHGAGLRLREVPIQHRPRAEGGSRAIPPRSIPRVAVTHTQALFRLWRDLARQRRASARDPALSRTEASSDA